MRVAIGADHAGFVLKQHLRRTLEQKGHEVLDEGTFSADSCDYPDYARAVARDVAAGRADRGVLVCSTGVGMSIAANKVDGVRAALATSAEEVRLVRSHNDANVLTLGARYLDDAAADSLVDVFLSTGFDGGRHARRLEKISAIERNGTGKLPEEKSL
ncbi:MAG: ribose 5-phosphate isomerase B [Acidobacteriota bacterium]